MITLRPYQARDIDAIRRSYALGKKKPLYVLSTGGGKTVTFAHITAGAAAKNNRVVIMAHRIELLDQISGALSAVGATHGFVAAGYATDVRQTMVASVQTLVRRLDSIPPPSLIVIDEAHHARSATYEAIIKHWPAARVLGVTATPVRQSGEGLGELFDEMILGPSMAELMSGGYLAAYRMFSPPTVDTASLHIRGGEFIQNETDELMNKPSITGCALEHYREHADNLPAIAFCVSVDHAKAVAEQFRTAGYAAVTLNGSMDKETRRNIVSDFKAGVIRIITSCDVLSEGFDVPGAHCGIFLRPTSSIGLYLQQIGRILRPCEGKSHAILLDHCGNALRHGLPDEPREWSLEPDQQKRSKSKPSISTLVCPKCFATLRSGTRACTNCQFEFPIKPRVVDEVAGELQEIDPEILAARRSRKHEQGIAQSLEQLKEIENRKGYKKGWAEHVYRARLAKRA